MQNDVNRGIWILLKKNFAPIYFTTSLSYLTCLSQGAGTNINNCLGFVTAFARMRPRLSQLKNKRKLIVQRLNSAINNRFELGLMESEKRIKMGINYTHFCIFVSS